MSGGSLRLFLAVPLPLPAIAELRALQQTLATRLSPAELGLRFTRAEQLHLTLKFVGESSEARAAELSRVLAAEAHQTPPLQARFTGVTAFPSVRRARVVVAELAEASGALAALSERLEQACVSLGVARQSRAYRPHVTLARARPPANLAKHLDCPAFAAAGVALSEIVLFRSTPSATGSVYTALARAAFVAPQ